MIRVKFYNSKQKNFDERKERIADFNVRDFYRLVEGIAGIENKTPPFRDADSMRFIREIDHAEFVEGDWYSIVTPFGRTNVTALCGGTRFALVVLHNSRLGVYTNIKYHPSYGEDIWSRLGVVSVDILVAFDISKLDPSSPYLPIRADYMIENYPYQEKIVPAHIACNRGGEMCFKDGVYFGDNYFPDLAYRWYKDIGGLIAATERLIKEHGRSCPFPPKTYPLGDFPEIFDEEGSDGVPMESGFMIKSFLQKMELEEPTVKYPVNLVITKASDGRCMIEQLCSVKYPTYSETVKDHFELFTKREDEVYVLVLDAGQFYEGADTLQYAIWGIRAYECVLELYDGVKVLEEFLRELKDPYERGNLFIRYTKWKDGSEVTVTERAGDNDVSTDGLVH